MTELAIRAASRPSMPDKIRYARDLAASSMLPKQFQDKPANVLWAIEYGDTLGITTMAAITGIHVIENKPSASAALIGGLVRRAGHKLRVTGNNQRATAQIIRSDDPEYVYEVTWELRRNQAGNPNAEDAGLMNKAVWKNFPAAMLKARAITQVARDACEEILFGLHYTPEELGAEVDAEGEPVERPTQRQQTAEDPWYTTGPAAPVEKQPEPVPAAAEDGIEDGIEDAEIVGEEPEPAAEPKSTLMANQGQRTNLVMRFGEKGITDRTERLDHTSALLERCVPSFRDLTFAEYQTVAKALHGGWPHIQPGPTPLPEPPADLEDNPVRDILASGIADANSPATLHQAGADIASELARGSITPTEAEYLREAWRARSDALKAEHAAVAA